MGGVANASRAAVLAAIAIVLGLGETRCGSLLSDDPELPVVNDAGPPIDAAPEATPDADPVDAGVDGPTCPTATETLPLSDDGSLNPSTATDHQDLSGLTICNLAQLYCLVQFKRVDSKDKKLVSVTLKLPRATSSECDGAADSCQKPVYHGSGTLLVRHMRTDWNDRATWFKRHPNVSSDDEWGADGALGNNDATAPIASPTIGKDEELTLTIDAASLSPAFLGEGLAFHLQAQPTFQYVLQRRKGSAASRATLDVTYCTE